MTAAGREGPGSRRPEPPNEDSRAGAAIIVIAKSPRPGHVKTRLCPPCTPRDAAGIARAALADTLTTVMAAPASARVLALDGPPGDWIPEGFAVVPQIGGGLDERLAHAFATVPGPAVLIGMDTPQVSVDHLARALRTLLTPNIDAVLGPAVDGGWWAIGLRRADPRVFVGVPMSTDHTYRDQRRRLHDLGLRTVVLDHLRDVDTFADASAVARSIPRSRFAAAVQTLERAERVAG
jgi:rSAM/selenodomain-associated transferase 1